MVYCQYWRDAVSDSEPVAGGAMINSCAVREQDAKP